MRMKSRDVAVSAIAAIIVLVIVILLVIIAVKRLTISSSNSNGYAPVNHGLDDEEIEFKKSIEKENAVTTEDVDELFPGEDTEDLKFDTKDRDTLRMLEKFRSNLIAGAGISSIDPESATSADVLV